MTRRGPKRGRYSRTCLCVLFNWMFFFLLFPFLKIYITVLQKLGIVIVIIPNIIASSSNSSSHSSKISYGKLELSVFYLTGCFFFFYFPFLRSI